MLAKKICGFRKLQIERQAEDSAGVIKITTKTNETHDCVNLRKILTESDKKDKKETDKNQVAQWKLKKHKSFETEDTDVKKSTYHVDNMSRKDLDNAIEQQTGKRKCESYALLKESKA